MFRKFLPRGWNTNHNLLFVSVHKPFAIASAHGLTSAKIPLQPKEPDFPKMFYHIGEIYRHNDHNFQYKKTIREIFDLTSQWHLFSQNDMKNPNYKIQIEIQKNRYAKRIKAFLYNLHYENNLESILLLFKVLYNSGARDPEIFNILLVSFLNQNGLQNLEVLDEFLDLWFSVLETQMKGADVANIKYSLNLSKMFHDSNLTGYFEQLLKIAHDMKPENEELLFKILCKSFRILRYGTNSTLTFQDNFFIRSLLPGFESKILNMMIRKTSQEEIIQSIGLLDDLVGMVFISSRDKIFAVLRILFRRLDLKSWEILHVRDLLYSYINIMQSIGQLDIEFFEKSLFPYFLVPIYELYFKLSLLQMLIICNYSNEAYIIKILDQLKSKKTEIDHFFIGYFQTKRFAGILTLLHTVLIHFNSDPRFANYIQTNFKEFVRLGNLVCVSKQLNINIPMDTKHDCSCTEFRKNFKTFTGKTLMSLQVIKDSQISVSPHESFLFNSMLKHFNDIFKKYKIEMHINYPMCKYRIDFYLRIDSLDIEVAIELSGSFYTFISGEDTGKARHKMDFIRNNGVVLVRLFNDSTFQHIHKILDYRRMAELVAFATQLEVEKTKGITLDLNFIS